MKRFVFASVFALLTTVSAHALDLTEPTLKTIDGKEFTDQNGKQLSLTADAVIENSLLAVQEGSDKEKGDNWRLAQRVYNARKDITFTPDEIIRIRKAVSVTQNTAVFGAVMVFIDPTFGK